MKKSIGDTGKESLQPAAYNYCLHPSIVRTLFKAIVLRQAEKAKSLGNKCYNISIRNDVEIDEP